MASEVIERRRVELLGAHPAPPRQAVPIQRPVEDPIRTHRVLGALEMITIELLERPTGSGPVVAATTGHEADEQHGENGNAYHGLATARLRQRDGNSALMCSAKAFSSVAGRFWHAPAFMAAFRASALGMVRCVSETDTVSAFSQMTRPPASAADSEPSAAASACQSFAPYIAAAIGAVMTNAEK